MSNSSHPAQISGLSQIALDYRFVLCDVWGVIHNGVSAYADAVDALARFRAGGGAVLLITNAPRPRKAVREQLARLGVTGDAYDEIITSGDVTRGYLIERPDARIFHLGPDRDLTIYDDLPNRLVDEGEADLISCTGLFDDTRETPDDYDDRLRRLAERRLPMLCANPDRVVERGDQLVWCAGALADRYSMFGGETIIVGKPHAPIYRDAFGLLDAMAGGTVARQSIVAIGDGAATDIRGAVDQLLDVVFVTDGIHAAELGPREAPDPAAVSNFLAAAGLVARNFIGRLKW